MLREFRDMYTRRGDLMSTPTTRIVHLRPDLPIALTEAGSGRPALILHGGGGPFTVAGIGDHLAETLQTITPTHPGWNGTQRPDWLLGISDIAQTYVDYLESEKLRDVLVIGSSLGGGSGPRWPSATTGAASPVLS
jgi:pimeloyl-ACP methyl ester carboxylesterase